MLLWAHGGASAPALFLFGVAAIVSAPLALLVTRGLGTLLQKVNLTPASGWRMFVSVWVLLTMGSVAVLVNVLGL